MKPYLALLSARFRMLLQYRAAAAAGFATQLFWGYIRLMIFEAFYRSAAGPQPMAWAEVVPYIWLGQAMLGMMPWNADSDIRAMIRTGTVACEMVRPLDLYAYWYTRALAIRSAPTTLRAAPLFVLAGLFGGMTPPHSWEAAAAWVAATAAALFLSAAISTLLNITLLWTIAGDGIVRLALALVMLFSGLVIPLPLFPDWAQPVLRWMPFGGVMDAPFRLYVGHTPPGRLPLVLAHQIGWTVALALLGRFLLSRGTRRLVVQGG